MISHMVVAMRDKRRVCVIDVLYCLFIYIYIYIYVCVCVCVCVCVFACVFGVYLCFIF